MLGGRPARRKTTQFQGEPSCPIGICCFMIESDKTHDARELETNCGFGGHSAWEHFWEDPKQVCTGKTQPQDCSNSEEGEITKEKCCDHFCSAKIKKGKQELAPVPECCGCYDLSKDSCECATMFG
ncbi:unnamed protein product [Amoebophrya sp. A120]|nr:unnamed protein product [Amoebophrya sp. A120]|eukprot:GSA120T00014790001.1